MSSKRQPRLHCSWSVPDFESIGHEKEERTGKTLLVLEDTTAFDSSMDPSTSDKTDDFDDALRAFFLSYFEDGCLDLDCFVEAHAALSKAVGEDPDKMKAVAAFLDFSQAIPPFGNFRSWVLQVLAARKVPRPHPAVRIMRWCARQDGSQALRREALDRRRLRKVEERTKRREESNRAGRLHLEMRRKEAVENFLQKDMEKREQFALNVVQLRRRDLLQRAKVLGLPRTCKLPSSASLHLEQTVPAQGNAGRPGSRADSNWLPDRAVTAPDPVGGAGMDMPTSMHFPPPPITILDDAQSP